MLMLSLLDAVVAVVAVKVGRFESIGAGEVGRVPELADRVAGVALVAVDAFVAVGARFVKDEGPLFILTTWVAPGLLKNFLPTAVMDQLAPGQPHRCHLLLLGHVFPVDSGC